MKKRGTPENLLPFTFIMNVCGNYDTKSFVSQGMSRVVPRLPEMAQNVQLQVGHSSCLAFKVTGAKTGT